MVRTQPSENTPRLLSKSTYYFRGGSVQEDVFEDGVVLNGKKCVFFVKLESVSHLTDQFVRIGASFRGFHLDTWDSDNRLQRVGVLCRRIRVCH